jgi:capsular exopolysaccharide synthesis family protein
MELIEKALAKAKREKATGKDGEQGQSAPAPGAAAPGATRGTVSVSYSRTRKVDSAHAHWENNRLVGGKSGNNVADIFRILRTKVLLPMREHGWRTLGIVGPTAGVGKTTISANLAMSIAMDENQTVLLVDLDLRRPRLAQYFGVEPRLGLADYLEDRASVEDILVNPGVERLVLLPSCGSRANSSELIASAKMRALFDEVRGRYESRIVIFDMPPLLVSSDSLLFLPRFDAVVMVVEDGASTRDQLVQSREMLGSANLLGWVLNKGRIDEQSYYY